MEIQIINGASTEAFFQELNLALDAQRPTLFRSLGDALVANVKRRIITSDEGRWALASKWLRAKTGQQKVLKGVEKYVRFTVSKDILNIVGKGGKWSLTQHHEGFTNQLVGETERRDSHGRVILKIKDGRPLNLYTVIRRNRRSRNPISRVGRIEAQEFRFVPHRAGHTPARKIWPTGQESETIVQPIAFKWLEKVVGETGGVLLR